MTTPLGSKDCEGTFIYSPTVGLVKKQQISITRIFDQTRRFSEQQTMREGTEMRQELLNAKKDLENAAIVLVVGFVASMSMFIASHY